MKADLIVRLKATEASIKTICSVTGAPGLSLGVLQGGKIVHSAHYGYQDVDNRTVPDSYTVYDIASLSKSFTASAVGILVDEGKLSWTTSVKSILDDLNSRALLVTELTTVTDLLTHDTGLAFSNRWWNGTDGELLLGKDQIMSSFNSLTERAKFRKHFEYNNWNYCLVEEIIENLSGMSYRKSISSRILDPLVLQNTYVSHDDTISNLAKPYAVLDVLSTFLLPFPKVQNGIIMAPAQALRSTTNDMLKYASALLGAQKEGFTITSWTNSRVYIINKAGTF